MASGRSTNNGYGRQDSQVPLTKAEAGILSSTSEMGSLSSDPFPERLNSMEKPQYDEVFTKGSRRTLPDRSSWGWGELRPKGLQGLNRPWVFLIFLCLFAMAQSATISGLVLISITTLERRFNLPSTRTGTISSCFEFVVMAVIVFVTYAGEKRNKPVIIGIGAAIFAVGSFVYTLPHFLTGLYEYGGNVEDDMCRLNQTAYSDCGEDSEGLSQYFWVFIAAQTLHGLGAAPLYALGQAFLYENIEPKSSSVYIGIFQAAATFSPAIGFLGGGLLLDSLYTDLTVPSDELEIDSSSPLWVGNWWAGFLVVGVITSLSSIPLMGFPKHLPGAQSYGHKRKPSTQKGAEFTPSAGFGGSLKDFPRAMFTLLKNPPYLLINLAVACENFIVACISVFGPKFVESQFNVTSGEAAILVGVVIIPAGLFGCLFGGWIIKRFHLEFRGQVKFCLAVLFGSFLLSFAFVLPCDNVPFAGITRSYIDNALIQTPGSVDATCNAHCGCSDDFDPVCGSNNILYYTACHAGCTATNIEETMYVDCGCIKENITDDGYVTFGEAMKGRCENTCSYKPIFFALIAVILALSFSIIVPTITTVLQVVSPSQRSTAMGLQSLLYRGLGTVPGPIVFGALIDRSCILWERECDGSGTCWMYRNKEFAFYTFGIVVICRVLSLLFFTGSLCAYKPIEETREDTTKG